MDAVVLAGGFAKRMGGLTENRPKHLLPIAGKPMLQYVLEKIEEVADIQNIYITTNEKYRKQFELFLGDYSTDKKIQLFIEPAHAETEKLGSLGGLGSFITQNSINHELLIIGGDNLFQFSLNELHAYYRLKGGDVIAICDICSLEKAKLYGIATTDENGRIISFQEKPDEPTSTLAATACFILSAASVLNVLKYLEEGNSRDEMGNFISWLHKKTKVYGYTINGIWFDIGSPQSYKAASGFYGKT